MPRKLRVALLQLAPPLLNLNSFKKDCNNIPLPAGYLKAYAHARGLAEEAAIDIAPRVLMDLGGDSAVAEWIAEGDYDLVGFSLYQWNALRSLDILRRVKKKRPKLRCIVGGPEVSPWTGYLKRQGGIDFMADGEGEELFRRLLLHLTGSDVPLEEIPGLIYRRKNEWVSNPQGGAIEDLGTIPSPYLNGYIDFKYYGTMNMETMRGCPFRCKYCSWSRGGRKGISFFPLERLREEILLAREMNFRAIEFVDANCNVSREGLRALCAMIAEVNKDKGLSFHGYLKVELLDEESIRWLSEANFNYAVVGPQTVNPEAGGAMGRPLRMDEFCRGVALMKSHGLEFRPSVILGLPGDTLAGFRRSLDFLAGQGLNNPICFPLSVSPNSTLYREAAHLGLRFQKAPPNLIISTPTMSFDDIRTGVILFRERFSRGIGEGIFEKDRRNLASRGFARGELIRRNAIPALITHPEGRSQGASRAGKSAELEKILRGNLPPVTRVILSPESRCSERQTIRTAAKLLAGRVSWNTLLWLEDFREGARDKGFLEAFLPILTGRNPHHVWHMVFEADGRHPISIDFIQSIRGLIKGGPNLLDAESLYDQDVFAGEYCRNACSFYAIMNTEEQRDSDGATWLEEIKKILPVFLSASLPDRTCELPGRGYDGLLLDAGPGASISEVYQRLNILRSCVSGQHLIFRSWVIDRVWNIFFGGHAFRWTTDETLLRLGENMRGQVTPFTDEYLMKCMQEWLRIRNRYFHTP